MSPAPATQTAAPFFLAGATRAEITRALAEIGVPERELRMRAGQLWHWIYHRGVREFSRDAQHRPAGARRARRALHAGAAGDRRRAGLRRRHPQVAAAHAARPSAATRAPRSRCVYIPETDRGTLCVSSQVGCTLNCTFCHTGTQAWVRNLTAAEIVGQVLVARDRLGDFPGGVAPTDGLVPSGEGVRAVSNVVFMGMGEPLYNFDNVRDAIAILTDGDGLSLSKRRITVSTSGVVPGNGAARRANAGPCSPSRCTRPTTRCATSWCRSTRNIRSSELLQACRDYPGASNARRITFEYVMLKGVNDSPAEAKALVRLLKGLPAKINLIPFNPWPGSPYECSDWETIERFSDIVFNAGYASPVRTPRGRDILAACGQLKSETEKLGRARALMLEESLAVGLD